MIQTLNASQKIFVDMMLDDNVYTNEALAEACAVDVRTIYRWKRNETITKEINKQADAKLGQFINQANMKLLEVITSGSEHAQLKAIDILYKSLGKYKESTDVTIHEGNRTVEEKKASLLSRLKG
jgi:hypothetical protein